MSEKEYADEDGEADLPPTCPLCFLPSKDGEVHPICADLEQAYSDYVAAKIAGELD